MNTSKQTNENASAAADKPAQVCKQSMAEAKRDLANWVADKAVQAAVKLAGQKPGKVYRLAYPCTIYFDVEAISATSARAKGVEFINGIQAGLAQDLDADGVMVYPDLGKQGVALPGRLSVADITLPE